MVLPALVTIIITTVTSLFVLGGAALVFPDLGNLLWAGIFLIAAFFVPEAILYKSRKVQITLKTVFGLFGIGIIMMTLLKMQLPSFFFGIAMPVTAAADAGEIITQLQFFGIEPASLGSILVVIAGTVAGSLVLDKVIYKRQLFKKRRLQ